MQLTEIVRQNYCVAWILKSENSNLGRGDRGNSLSSAREYYEKCKINLIEQDG